MRKTSNSKAGKCLKEKQLPCHPAKTARIFGIVTSVLGIELACAKTKPPTTAGGLVLLHGRFKNSLVLELGSELHSVQEERAVRVDIAHVLGTREVGRNLTDGRGQAADPDHAIGRG